MRPGHAIFVSLATFLIGGHLIVVAGLPMGVGQIAGAWLGSHLVLKRGTGFVRLLFLAVVAATIAKLLWDTPARKIDVRKISEHVVVEKPDLAKLRTPLVNPLGCSGMRSPR